MFLIVLHRLVKMSAIRFVISLVLFVVVRGGTALLKMTVMIRLSNACHYG